MRLTIAMKDRIKKTLTDKVYPTGHREKEWKDRAVHAVLSEPDIKTRKMLAEKYPQYTKTVATIAMVCDGRRNIYIPLPYPIAATDGESSGDSLFVTYSKSRSSGYRKAETDKIFEEIREYDRVREEFKNKLTPILDSCTTTKQLRELLPEAAEYIPEDPKKLATSLALVPVKDIQAVRSIIGVALKEERDKQKIEPQEV